MALRLKELVDKIGGELIGDGECLITGTSSLIDAQCDQLTFLANPRYKNDLKSTSAAVVILSRADSADCPVNVWVSDNPYACYAYATQLLYPNDTITAGIHPTATVSQTATVSHDSYIDAHCYLGPDVDIGSNCYIGPGCILNAAITIDANTRLIANVTVSGPTTIGQRCLIHPGVVLGADGFGFANEDGHWVKIQQTGAVFIGDDVEIGSNTTIDRGALQATTIGKGVKLDNQIQIGHNVQIGDHTAIAACTAVAGSTHIGKHCAIGGCAGIVGHLNITDHVHITGMSMVTHSIKKPGVYSSGIPAEENSQWRKNTVRYRQLDDLAKRVRELERRLGENSNKK